MTRWDVRLEFVCVALTAVLALGCGEKETGLYPPTDTTPPVTVANPPGGTHSSTVSVELISNEPSTIYYTTDGSTPTTSSYTDKGPSPLSGIEISANTMLKFFAVDTVGNHESVKIQSYVISAGPDVTPPTTTAYPPGGTYDSAVSVTLTPDEPATVYYTTDGSTPDMSSTVYSSPISVVTDTTLRFFAVDTAGNEEVVKTEGYVITGGGDVPVIMNITPDSGPAGSEVTIDGSNFGISGTVTFHNGKGATTSSWSDAKIVCIVPPASQTGEVTVTTVAGTSNGVLFTVTDNPDWEFIGSISYEGAVLAGKRFCIEFDNGSESLSIVEEGAGELTEKAKQAVERAPKWVRAALVETLAAMSSSDQDSNANKILGASDPYVDEWAFIIAHQVGGDPPLIDEIAQHLLYVQVMNYGTSETDPNYYTTLKYALKDVSTGEAVWIELPKEIYYMQLVAHSGSNMRSLFFSANYGDPAIKDSVGKDAAYPGKYICMTDWASDDGTFECALRGDWKGNGVPTSISPLHTYPQPGVG